MLLSSVFTDKGRCHGSPWVGLELLNIRLDYFLRSNKSNINQCCLVFLDFHGELECVCVFVCACIRTPAHICGMYLDVSIGVGTAWDTV